MSNTTLGVVDGNRGIFPGHLCEAGRKSIVGVLEQHGLDTYGGYGVVEVPALQDLPGFICRNGFEHHVAATRANVALAIDDALTNYLGWNTYHHGI